MLHYALAAELKRKEELGLPPQTVDVASEVDIAATRSAIDEQQRLLDDVNNTRAVLDSIARTGFLDLPEVVVDEFQAEGFTWGGQWADFKDYMHFEIGEIEP